MAQLLISFLQKTNVKVYPKGEYFDRVRWLSTDETTLSRNTFNHIN